MSDKATKIKVFMLAGVVAAIGLSAVRPHSFAAFFSVMTVVAMAGLWELVEWQYAVIDGGDAGAAFLGSQGDIWDAQKDILCDTLGALCAVTLFLLGYAKRL